VFFIIIVWLNDSFLNKGRRFDMREFVRNGFSMIEVLVSILVLSLGVIGAAGMQLTALRTTQQSAFQSAAVQLAADMADAIRVSVGRVEQKGDANPFLGVDYKSAADSDPAVPGKVCYASECDADELAEFEIYEWKKRVKASLPGGRIVICHDSTPWNSAARALTWACNGGMESNAPLVIKLGWQAKNPDGSLIKDADNLFPPTVALTVSPA
jgi:type IV pilus assembly protein PilV